MFQMQTDHTWCLLLTDLHNTLQSESQAIFHFRSNSHKGVFQALIFKEGLGKNQEHTFTSCTTTTSTHRAYKPAPVPSGDKETVLLTAPVSLLKSCMCMWINHK